MIASTPRPSSVVIASMRRDTSRRASTSRPESISSRIANFGRSTASCSVSARFCSPPENSTLTPRSRNRGSTASRPASAPSRSAMAARSWPSRGALTVAFCTRGLQHVDEPHARHFDRVLHRQEQALLGPLPGGQTEDLLAVDRDRPVEHLVVSSPHQRVRERRLARAVGAHERVHLARTDLEIDPAQDLVPRDRRTQPGDRQHTHAQPPPHAFLRQQTGCDTGC